MSSTLWFFAVVDGVQRGSTSDGDSGDSDGDRGLGCGVSDSVASEDSSLTLWIGIEGESDGVFTESSEVVELLFALPRGVNTPGRGEAGV